MNSIPCKNGTIYHYMKKYRTRRLITVIILICLLSMYLYSSRAYFSNAIYGAQYLDESRYSKEVTLRDVGEEFELHRSDPTAIEAYALKANSYWQDNNYEFIVKLKNPVRTDVVYTTTHTGSSGSNEVMESAILYTADIGGIPTLVLAYPHHNLKDGESVVGVFTKPALIINHDIAKSESFENDSEICTYMLDIRGISMDSQFADLAFCFLILILILYLAIRLIFQYINPLLTPTYKGIDKYGEISDTIVEIERQLLDKTQNKKIKGKVITEGWIVEKDTFKLKITKNHMQKH